MKEPNYAATSIEALNHVLADTYVIAVKTQNAHWNMQGPSFIGVHKLLDEQYSALQDAIDMIAERIRALGGNAPHSMASMLALTRLSESEVIKDLDMTVKSLCQDHAEIRDLMLSHIPTVTEAGDEGTADMLVERIREHDLQAWLLGAHLSR